MSERKHQESPVEFGEQRESTRVEPDWTDIKASKAWLEERYPLLDDASLGSPLFRWMKACVKLSNQGSTPMFLASMLSFHEMWRWSGETGITVTFDPNKEKLYPGYGFPNQDRVQEPNWNDKDASGAWLERTYPLGPASIGSPLYQYMQESHENRCLGNSSTTSLGLMLTNSELKRFCMAFPNSASHRPSDEPQPIVLYPEYNSRLGSAQVPSRQSTGYSQFPSGLPHVKSPPPPAADPSTFTEFYPPRLRSQSPSSNPSNKRKVDDDDDATPELPANKRRRNPSDLSGGILMSAKSHNSYGEGLDDMKQENDTGSIPPSPRPDPNAASVNSGPNAMSLGQQRNRYEMGSSGEEDIVNMAAEKDPRVFDLDRHSTEMQTAGHVRQIVRSMETPKTGGPVRMSPVATNAPAHAHNRPMLTKTKPQHDQEAYSEGSETDDLGHQPYGQHTNGRTLQNDENAAHEPANENTSPLGPDPQRENQVHVEENPDAMDLDSDDQISASQTKIARAGPSKKRGTEDVDDGQPARSPSKKRRASIDEGGDDSLISSPPIETSLAESSGKSSTEGVEDAPPITSSPGRKRAPPESSGVELPPSSPFDPTERSTPTPLPRSHNSLRQESPPYEDPTTVIFRPSETAEPALQSGSQSEATDGRSYTEARNTDEQPTADLKDHGAALNGGSEAQEPGKDGASEPYSQGAYHMNLGEGPVDMIIDPENPRDQTTTDVRHSSSDRTEQTAMPQRQPITEQDLSPDELTMDVPVIQSKRKRGRKPGTKAKKAPQSELQLEQGKPKPPTKGRKHRQLKPEREQQAYVGRLRSGLGERKHRKPSKYFMPT